LDLGDHQRRRSHGSRRHRKGWRDNSILQPEGVSNLYSVRYDERVARIDTGRSKVSTTGECLCDLTVETV
jgi:hypothetical protein